MKKYFSTYALTDSLLEITFLDKIDFSISIFLGNVLQVTAKEKITFLLLDFEKIKFITLPGAMYVLSFSQYINQKQNLTAQFKGMNNNVQHFLMSIGIFSKLQSRGGFLISKNILLEEERMINIRQASENTIIFPIHAIIYNTDKSYFQDYTKWFIDKFKSFFLFICKYPVFNFKDNADDSQELFETLYENIKNIFDHSESEGFGAIHASTYLKGTTMAFFDVGIGIAKSVSRTKGIDVKNEIDFILWAFKDGNSSKIEGHNQGHGFPIFQEFCDKRDGILTVKTSKYLFIYRNKKWNILNSNWFPGTQIVIYNPLKEK